MPEPTDPADTEDEAAIDPLLPTTPPIEGGQRETVTIEDGEHSISVTSPDGQGHVTVTVDDGSGDPKTYDLDFGAGTEPGPALGTGATPGSVDRPGPAPQTPLPAGGEFAPAPGAPEPRTIQADEDGVCVIEDGDLTITAEHPEGSTDTVLVTVDNGDGEPTSYTLNYSDPTGAAVQPTPAPAADVRTLPAQQEPPTTGRIDPVAAQPMPAVEPGAIPRQDVPVAAEQYGATTAQASFDPISGGSLSNEAAGGGDAGLSRANDSSPYADIGRPGEAGLSRADDSPGGGHAQPGMAGMPMLGGGGAGGGGDQARSGGSQWRTTGDLFDDVVDTQLGNAFGDRH